MNINDLNYYHQCTSCQLCAAVCPVNAIQIHLNKYGFYRPFIDENLCVNCGKCVKICYKYDNDILFSEQKLMNKPLYSAWSRDNEQIKNTTSGGIADILARKLILNGYKVVGVIYNESKIRAEHKIASSIEETVLFRGSKYIQSYTIDVMKEVVANCKSTKYAIFGTPCQIYALNRITKLKNNSDNFIFIDLYCHGCPSLHVWLKYQTYIKKKLKIQTFDKVEFRSKIKGWGSFNVVVRKGEKDIFKSNPKEDGFYELFFSDLVLNEECNNCKLRSTLEYTDIRLGDFWGKKYLDNYKGVSAISLASEKGQNLFGEIKNDIISQKCDYNDFLPYQSWGKNYKVNEELRNRIMLSLSNPQEEIDDAVKVLINQQTFKYRMIRCMKHLLYYLPLGFTNLLKKIKFIFH